MPVPLRLAWERANLATWITSNAYVQEASGQWVPVDLWPEQAEVCECLQWDNYLLVLKARQLGLTWLCVWEICWRMLRNPGLQVGVYSLREEEAIAVVGRLKQVYERINPNWRAWGQGIEIDNNNHWQLFNGSGVRAFSGSSGDSYTFGYVLVDEADLLQDLSRVLRSAEPTLSGGGQMRLVSRANKDTPQSLFKAMFRAARRGQSKWREIFLPWWSRPGRTKEWYEEEKRGALATRGNLDFVYEQYPAHPEQALAPSESDKRFPMEWVDNCFEDRQPISPAQARAIVGLEVWALPQNDVRYFIGGDPAEGNPTSDESAAQVIDQNGIQVAQLRGRKQPSAFAAAIAVLSEWYKKASVLIERNNHGHAVHLALTELYPDVPVLCGRDGKLGWLSSPAGNIALYDHLADAIRDRRVKVYSQALRDQLQTIRGADLSAPEGLHDDLADAFGLAEMARELSPIWAEPTLAPNPRAVPVQTGPRTEPTRPPHWK